MRNWVHGFCLNTMSPAHRKFEDFKTNLMARLVASSKQCVNVANLHISDSMQVLSVTSRLPVYAHLVSVNVCIHRYTRTKT